MTRDRIYKYPRHAEEARFVHDLLGTAGVPAVLDTVGQIIRGGAPDEVGAALYFVMDVGRYSFMPEEVTARFRQEVLDSGLLGLMGDALYRDSYRVRAEIIPTLGRLCFPEAAPMLVAAFDHYLRNDPLLVPVLLRELFRLTARRDWRYVERAAAGEHYLSRWSAVEFLQPPAIEPGTAGYEVQKRLALRMIEDPSPLVRSDARHRYEYMQLGETRPRLSRTEGQTRYRSIHRRAERSLTFGDLRSRFWTDRDSPDYTVAELAAFAESLIPGE